MTENHEADIGFAKIPAGSRPNADSLRAVE
jgi:hypothetical protein